MSVRAGVRARLRQAVAMMAMAVTGAAMLQAVTPQIAQAAPAPARIALAYYPGWIQDELPPEEIDYSAWTHIMHFGIYPNSDGGLGWDNMEAQYPAEAVRAAHAAGRKINLVIGSDGVGARFQGATRPENLAVFIDNIVETVTTHGYDGVDIDWEEDLVEDRYIALIKGLSQALDRADPTLELTTDVITAFVSPAVAAEIADDVDWINVMSYWSWWRDELSAYTDAGIGANKLAVGIGLYTGTGDEEPYHDVTKERVAEKTAYATAGGHRGVLAWSLQHLDGQDDPRLMPLREYVGGQGKGCASVGLNYPAYPALTAGTSRAEVAAAQCLLAADGSYGGRATGTMDTGTVSATRRFQERTGLPVTGTVAARTWTALLAAGTTPLLRSGASGAAVSRLQRALNAVTTARLAVDGQFGPNTTSAVRGYQTSRGLGADGVVGAKTWAALQAGRVADGRSQSP
ncbi:Peptidoglycan-binding (PGRP) domain of peptidoglycan hydrolases-containing protein [Amycolatopsis marina]|uniref:chitinase n=1 Tax=Amycolatopsis marina TaxID=490629 RepID=A0A1I0V7B0_9PSEU|nr:peptidoglycan-binding protein [Amycolatopsis marina]SFA72239.1 Peptidoglycan-binding (PGRP) domain of peptidoglycan hydrolases-containing protein [Amycolatopsis marina]